MGFGILINTGTCACTGDMYPLGQAPNFVIMCVDRITMLSIASSHCVIRLQFSVKRIMKI